MKNRETTKDRKKEQSVQKDHNNRSKLLTYTTRHHRCDLRLCPVNTLVS